MPKIKPGKLVGGAACPRPNSCRTDQWRRQRKRNGPLNFRSITFRQKAER
jgi:hypothetical protein